MKANLQATLTVRLANLKDMKKETQAIADWLRQQAQMIEEGYYKLAPRYTARKWRIDEEAEEA